MAHNYYGQQPQFYQPQNIYQQLGAQQPGQQRGSPQISLVQQRLQALQQQQQQQQQPVYPQGQVVVHPGHQLVQYQPQPPAQPPPAPFAAAQPWTTPHYAPASVPIPAAPQRRPLPQPGHKPDLPRPASTSPTRRPLPAPTAGPSSRPTPPTNPPTNAPWARSRTPSPEKRFSTPPSLTTERGRASPPKFSAVSLDTARPASLSPSPPSSVSSLSPDSLSGSPSTKPVVPGPSPSPSLSQLKSSLFNSPSLNTSPGPGQKFVPMWKRGIVQDGMPVVDTQPSISRLNRPPQPQPPPQIQRPPPPPIPSHSRPKLNQSSSSAPPHAQWSNAQPTRQRPEYESDESEEDDESDQSSHAPISPQYGIRDLPARTTSAGVFPVPPSSGGQSMTMRLAASSGPPITNGNIATTPQRSRTAYDINLDDTPPPRSAFVMNRGRTVDSAATTPNRAGKRELPSTPGGAGGGSVSAAQQLAQRRPQSQIYASPSASGSGGGERQRPQSQIYRSANGLPQPQPAVQSSSSSSNSTSQPRSHRVQPQPYTPGPSQSNGRGLPTPQSQPQVQAQGVQRTKSFGRGRELPKEPAREGERPRSMYSLQQQGQQPQPQVQYKQPLQQPLQERPRAQQQQQSNQVSLPSVRQQPQPPSQPRSRPQPQPQPQPQFTHPPLPRPPPIPEIQIQVQVPAQPQVRVPPSSSSSRTQPSQPPPIPQITIDPSLPIQSPSPRGGRSTLADIDKIETESEGAWSPVQSVRGLVGSPAPSVGSSVSVGESEIYSPRPVGMINIGLEGESDSDSDSDGGVPRIRVGGDVPRVNVNGTGEGGGGPPKIQVFEVPGISVSGLGDGPAQPVMAHPNSSRPVQAQANGTPTSSQIRAKGLACGGCGRGIVGRIVNAMGQRFHPACFRCAVCETLLEHVSSYEWGGRAYCHLDYHENFAPKCYSCKTPIYEERFISLDDPGLGKRAYHEQHFFCAECGDPFLAPTIGEPGGRTGELTVSGDGAFASDDVGFTVYKGHPYCEACHVRLRLPKCKRCKRSIRDRDEAVEALGGKWCWGCFVCKGCERPFEDPSFFERGGEPYCEDCFSVILRNEV